MIHLLFVCLGNICRSPTADGIMKDRIQRAGLSERIHVDSAGTGDWHIGREPDPRTVAAALQRGYDLSSLRARQVHADDFLRFDYILAMDRSNLEHLQAMCPPNYAGELCLFLDYYPDPGTDSDLLAQCGGEVPDPYYGEASGFDQVLDLVEGACDGLLAALCRRHGLSPA